MPESYVSFVIGFHTARADNLLQTLRLLAKHHPEIVTDSQLVLACQDRFDNLNDSVRHQLAILAKHFQSCEWLSADFPYMKLPALTNLGVAKAKAKRLVVLESDRILPAGYFAAALTQVRPGLQVTCSLIRKLTRSATDDEIDGGTFEANDDYRSRDNQVGRRNAWSGNTIIWAEDFENCGKMDETYKGYGWADSDMSNVTARAGIDTIFRDEIELHLWHPPATYGLGDQKQMFLDNGLYFCKKWNVPWPNWFRAELAARRKVLL